MKKFRNKIDKIKGIIRPPPSSSSPDKEGSMSVSESSQHNPQPPPPPAAGAGGDADGGSGEATADSAVPMQEEEENSMDVSPSLPASANKKRVPIVNNPEGSCSCVRGVLCFFSSCVFLVLRERFFCCGVFCAVPSQPCFLSLGF